MHNCKFYDLYRIEIVEKQMVFQGFRHARAADARMWPAWYYLIGIRATSSSYINACAPHGIVRRMMRGGGSKGIGGGGDYAR